MLTEFYIEALLVDEDLADEFWAVWDKGEIDDQVAWLAWCFIASNVRQSDQSSTTLSRLQRQSQTRLKTGSHGSSEKPWKASRKTQDRRAVEATAALSVE